MAAKQAAWFVCNSWKRLQSSGG